jgi:uncharacterized membrane protein YdbT with pleckstrin-like domain
MESIKPSVANALIPQYLRYFVPLLLVYAVLVALSTVINIPSTVHVVSVVAVAVLPLFPLLWMIVVLRNTSYHFKDSYVERRYDFISKRTHSVPYQNISQIQTVESLWDKLCDAGDLLIQTADDNEEDLKLRYVKNPKDIKAYLYNQI